jgi:ADP-ribosylglycohydrolase
MLLGMFLADAHAMPVHWYYDTALLFQDYGHVEQLTPPKDIHPQSMVAGNTGYYEGTTDILHDKKKYYGDATKHTDGQDHRFGDQKPHYHIGMKAGENTCNLHVARLVMRHVVEATAAGRGYSPDGFLKEFRAFLTTPGSHPDTYLDIYIRKFFENLDKGLPASRCARDQREQWSIGSMGGLIAAIPLVALYISEPEAEATARVIEHQYLTHRSLNVSAMAVTLVPLLRKLVAGADAATVVRKTLSRTHGPKWTGQALMNKYLEAKSPYNLEEDKTWLYHTAKAPEPFLVAAESAISRGDTDADVIGEKGLVSSACYTEHGMPAALYLALKYTGDFRAAIVANTNVGGDNCTRGAILGAIMGAACGVEGIPADWLGGLAAREEISKEIDAFLDLAMAGNNF